MEKDDFILMLANIISRTADEAGCYICPARKFCEDTRELIEECEDVLKAWLNKQYN